MALQQIRIGSAENILQYDDADFDSGIEVTAPIKCTAPVDATDVVRLEDLGGAGGADLTTLTDDSMADALHRHSELSASDGAPDACVQIDADGVLTLVGAARVGNDLFVGPSAVRAPLLKPATFADHGISGTWVFADADDETLVLNYRVPHRMDLTATPNFHIKWSAAGAGAGNCEWQIEYRYVKPNESTIQGAQDTENIIVAASAVANGAVFSETLGLDLPDATDRLLQVRVKRLAAGGNDTIAGTVELHGIDFHFTSNRLGEPV